MLSCSAKFRKTYMKKLLWVQAAFCAGVLLVLCVASGVAAQDSAPSGPSATKATVMIKDDAGVIPLKREEQIAFMFVQPSPASRTIARDTPPSSAR